MGDNPVQQPGQQPGQQPEPATSDITEGMRNIKLSLSNFAKPKAFSYGENISTFCDRFLEYVTINKITENLDLIFLSLVDNRTHSKLKGVAISADEKASVMKLCEAYQKALSNGLNDTDVMSAIFQLKQGSNESIDDLTYRLDLLASKITDMEQNQLDKFKIGALASAVNNELIKSELRKGSITSYLEAAKMAILIEGASPDKVGINKVNFREGNGGFSEEPEDGRRGADRGTPTQDWGQRGQRNKREYNLTCQICLKAGHSAIDCRRRNDSRSTQIKCFKCLKFGHVARDCWSRTSSGSRGPRNSYNTEYSRNSRSSTPYYKNSNEYRNQSRSPYRPYNRSQTPYNRNRNQSQSPRRPYDRYSNRNSRSSSPYDRRGRHNNDRLESVNRVDYENESDQDSNHNYNDDDLN